LADESGSWWHGRALQGPAVVRGGRGTVGHGEVAADASAGTGAGEGAVAAGAGEDAVAAGAVSGGHRPRARARQRAPVQAWARARWSGQQAAANAVP